MKSRCRIPVSIPKSLFSCVRSRTLVSKGPELVECAENSSVRCSGPRCQAIVFYCMSSTYFIWQILFQYDRHDITSVSDIASTCWNSTRQLIKTSLKIFHSGEMCTSDGWMYVYIFVCYYCVRRFMHVKNELRWYGSDLLPVGKGFCEFPRDCSGERTNTAAATLWKYEIFNQPHPKAKYLNYNMLLSILESFDGPLYLSLKIRAYSQCLHELF